MILKLGKIFLTGFNLIQSRALSVAKLASPYCFKVLIASANAKKHFLEQFFTSFYGGGGTISSFQV